MKLLFENQFIYTKDYYREFYKGIYLKKTIVIILNIILCISFITNLLLMIFPKLGTQDSNTSMVNIATILVIWCIQIYVYITKVNSEYNRELEKNKGKCNEIRLLVTEEGINISTSLESNVNIEFKNIEKVIKTKNYYMLLTKDKLGIALKKDGFVKGTAKEFEKFIREKKLL